MIIPVDGPARDTTTWTQSLGIGQAITPHDVPLFGDFTYYLCANAVEDMNARNNEFISLTPAFARTWATTSTCSWASTSP